MHFNRSNVHTHTTALNRYHLSLSITDKTDLMHILIKMFIQVPSFYPDPDQTHGGATFEGDTQDGGGIEAEVTSETTSDTSALTPAAPPNGGIKVGICFFFLLTLPFGFIHLG